MEQESGELHPTFGDSSLKTKITFIYNCPYLGTLEDADTSLSFPSAANHCLRTISPATVDLSHQEAYCLTDMYPGCHVFQQESKSTTAVGQTENLEKPKNLRRRVSVYALPLILILIFFAAVIWWPAPGTSFQEAIAFGSQLQRNADVETRLDNKSGAGEQPDQVAVPLPLEEGTESQGTKNNNQTATSPDLNSEMEEFSQPALPQQEESPVSESNTTGIAPVRETKTATTVEPEEIEKTAAAVEANFEELGKPEALDIFDLPVISNQIPDQSTTRDQPAATNPEGEYITLIGPDASTPLALREAANKGRALFVRQSPNLDSDLLTIINRRQQAAILGRDSSSTWYKVRLDTGVEGWVNAVESQAGVDPSIIPIIGSPAATAPILVSTVTDFPVIRSAVVNTGTLNLRSGPGVGYEPVTTINKGELVGLLGRLKLGVWVRIRLNSGLEGWVNSSLLAPLS